MYKSVLIILLGILGNFTGRALHPKTQEIFSKSSIVREFLIVLLIYMNMEKDRPEKIQDTAYVYAGFRLLALLPPKPFILAVLGLFIIEVKGK